MRDTEISPEIQSSASDPALLREEAQSQAIGAGKPLANHEVEQIRHTRISAAWAAVFIGVVLGVALIDFIVENTRSVRIDFFTAAGRVPVSVALLAAAFAGAAVVLSVGVCRTTQLRLSIRRHRRHPNAEITSPTAKSVIEGARQ